MWSTRSSWKYIQWLSYRSLSYGTTDYLTVHDNAVARYAKKEPKKHTINQLIQFGKQLNEQKLIQSARFVHQELPVRLAHRIIDLRSLPYYVVCGPIKRIYDVYVEAFESVRNFLDESANVVELLAHGLRLALLRASQREHLDLDSFVDQMLISRIGRRMIAEQHVMLHESRPGFVGVINTHCSPQQCLDIAYQECSRICFRQYGVQVPVQIRGSVSTIPYIPYHLHYILLELLKNSMRAVVERHLSQNHHKNGLLLSKDNMPPIEVLLTEGPKQVTIRISDQGGGIALDILSSIFRYGFSTVNRLREEEQGGGNLGGEWDRLVQRQSVDGPMAGLGFGLPLSKLYAQYFGGNLQLVSMDGYGTDVYVHLDRTGDVLEGVEI
ncbi:[Pyruvate dehydrogenase (acetyl-transferring)] kinase, mitochondrial [Galdieria sulphuraria]|nr:[Pyruvate dehydrogenase (acetyl-transferring)] kinase, mitochondrial [Galdieria sulphuraria]